MSNPRPLQLLFMTTTFAFLAACDTPKGDGATTASAAIAQSGAPRAASAAPTASATATTSATAAPGDATATIPADWVDVDLTPAGKAWVDYTLKAPPGAKVKKGTPDPSIESGDFAISLSFTHVKKSTASLDTARAYGVSWRALTDTPEFFEYETSGEQNGEKFVRFNFDVFVEVDGKKMGCSGLNNQKQREQLAPMIAACRTLKKKA